MTESPIGKTQDVGWQIGVSRTIAVDVATAWSYLTSPRGIEAWLGAGVDVPIEKGQRYETDDSTVGEFRSVRPHDRIRLTWQPVDRSDDATVQIALSSAKSGCTFRFHTERLYDSDERETMRQHWLTVAAQIEGDLTASSEG